MAGGEDNGHRRRSVRKASQSSYIVSRNAKNELRKKIKKVSAILKKPEHERTKAEKALVSKNPDAVKTFEKNARRLKANKERILEIEDEPDLLLAKCVQLAELIQSSKYVVVYTGAGISTAASIPDYRGPNGVWTLLKKGQEVSAQDLSDAEPTLTHMSLATLFRVGKVKHIVSQNCDGLHMRSGFPRHALSELHGNMFIECCYSCAPHKEYVRLFDVTERTGVHRHSTSRRCRTCGGHLTDTIVHFGEKGKLKSPYRWKEAVRAAKKADLILCLGSSLKVLKKYSCLWSMDKKPQYRPKLVIVNLQWTPKDEVATLKINGKCDSVMLQVMDFLGFNIPVYDRESDPIFHLCTPLRAHELKSTTKKILSVPSSVVKSPKMLRKFRSHFSKRSKSSKNNLSQSPVVESKLSTPELLVNELEEKTAVKPDKDQVTPPESVLPNFPVIRTLLGTHKKRDDLSSSSTDLSSAFIVDQQSSLHTSQGNPCNSSSHSNHLQSNNQDCQHDKSHPFPIDEDCSLCSFITEASHDNSKDKNGPDIVVINLGTPEKQRLSKVGHLSGQHEGHINNLTTTSESLPDNYLTQGMCNNLLTCRKNSSLHTFAKAKPSSVISGRVIKHKGSKKRSPEIYDLSEVDLMPQCIWGSQIELIPMLTDEKQPVNHSSFSLETDERKDWKIKDIPPVDIHLDHCYTNKINNHLSTTLKLTVEESALADISKKKLYATTMMQLLERGVHKNNSDKYFDNRSDSPQTLNSSSNDSIVNLTEFPTEKLLELSCPVIPSCVLNMDDMEIDPREQSSSPSVTELNQSCEERLQGDNLLSLDCVSGQMSTLSHATSHLKPQTTCQTDSTSLGDTATPKLPGSPQVVYTSPPQHHQELQQDLNSIKHDSEKLDKDHCLHLKNSLYKPSLDCSVGEKLIQLKTLKKPVISYCEGANSDLTVDDLNKERENICTPLSKRKPVVASIPGWFGKGLGFKKKKR
ncbi:uncharacterized protein LOC131938715 [Physella acuta]|uniref:uncharacterized protein LOC131938715 n=1 Tax=Physella acuta TaxID=109671 RepID=UPI0027DC3B1F|nr:uncharacterized protein LOC131938715 [Physella acuta]